MRSERVSQHEFVVLDNQCAAEGVWRLRIESAVAPLLEPGQFMNLTVPGNAARILKLPLSFKCADAAHATVELLYAVVGEGTQRLSQMLPGDRSTLVGPCGQGWRLPQERGRALLVAGGIGLPPVLAAHQMLAEAGVESDLVVGARTSSMLLHDDIDEAQSLAREGGRVVVCTDDGTAGLHGYVTQAMTDLLGEHSYAQVYTCGPTPMMAGVARLAAEHDLACQASLERMMGCGFGACSCCNVTLTDGSNALCCQDGPVFDAREVVW